MHLFDLVVVVVVDLVVPAISEVSIRRPLKHLAAFPGISFKERSCMLTRGSRITVSIESSCVAAASCH